MVSHPISGPKTSARGGLRTGLFLAGCVTVLALPSAVLAFSASFDLPDDDGIDSLDHASSKENLSRAIAMRSLSGGQMFPFTPAGTPNRTERSVTVAVRVDPEAAQAIIVNGKMPKAAAKGEVGRMRVAPSAFNLGVSRGYQTFAQQDLGSSGSAPKGLANMPELREFSLRPADKKDEPSRFSTRLSIDEKRAPGRAPRTFAGEEGEVDLSGAYRLTDNLNVTAGVRYSQERERLIPLTDGKQDSQAVYVGTQFRF